MQNNLTLEERTIILDKIKKLEVELQNVRGTECEVYSRIVGYFQRKAGWNPGKLEEFKDRVTFDIKQEGYK